LRRRRPAGSGAVGFTSESSTRSDGRDGHARKARRRPRSKIEHRAVLGVGRARVGETDLRARIRFDQSELLVAAAVRRRYSSVFRRPEVAIVAPYSGARLGSCAVGDRKPRGRPGPKRTDELLDQARACASICVHGQHEGRSRWCPGPKTCRSPPCGSRPRRGSHGIAAGRAATPRPRSRRRPSPRSQSATMWCASRADASVGDAIHSPVTLANTRARGYSMWTWCTMRRRPAPRAGVAETTGPTQELEALRVALELSLSSWQPRRECRRSRPHSGRQAESPGGAPEGSGLIAGIAAELGPSRRASTARSTTAGTPVILQHTACGAEGDLASFLPEGRPAGRAPRFVARTVVTQSSWRNQVLEQTRIELAGSAQVCEPRLPRPPPGGVCGSSSPPTGQAASASAIASILPFQETKR